MNPLIANLLVEATPCATAFLVAEGIFATALHALGKSHSELALQFFDEDGMPEGSPAAVEVLLSLPELDFALLEQAGGPARLESATTLVPFPAAQGHAFTIAGFPGALDSGLSVVSGTVGPRRAVVSERKRLPAFQLDPTNTIIEPPGFSGAPVYLSRLGGVVAVFGGYFRETGVHYAVPVSEILRRLPTDIRQRLDTRVLPFTESTGIARSYEAATFVPTLDEKAWQSALASDSPSVLVLRGPSGIGKSSHASTWALEARAAGLPVLWIDLSLPGAGIGSASPLAALGSMLQDEGRQGPAPSRESLLRQIARACSEAGELKGEPASRLVVVIDGIESLAERASFWRQLSNDLDTMFASGIPITAVCCERSEFAEADSYELETVLSRDIDCRKLLLQPLTLEEVLRVYEQGYRAKYPWLPQATSLPIELLELVRIPFFMQHLVRAVAELEMGRTNAAAVLNQALAHAVKQGSTEVLQGKHVDPLVTAALQRAILSTLKRLVTICGLSDPPKVEADANELQAEVAEVLQRDHIDPGLARPQEIISALSRTGTVHLRDHFVGLSSDVLYEYILALLLSERAAPAEDSDITALQEIERAIHDTSLSAEVPTAVRSLVDQLLSLPPSRETFAARFICLASSGVSQVAIDSALDLRLLQIVRDYGTAEGELDKTLDDALYSACIRERPTAYPEVLLAASEPSPADHLHPSESDIESPESPTETGGPKLSDPAAWLRMRRALFLLFMLSEYRLTALQHIAASIDSAGVSSFSERLALLARSILSRNPHHAVKAYQLGQVGDLTYLLSHIEFVAKRIQGAKEDFEWPPWFRWVVERILPDLPYRLEFTGDTLLVGPTILLLSVLNKWPEKAVHAIGGVLKSEDRDARDNVLNFLELLAKTSATQLPEDFGGGVGKRADLPAVFSDYAPLMRSELLLHSSRPNLPDKERTRASELAARYWAGDRPADSLPDDPGQRPYAIETSVRNLMVLREATVGEIVEYFSRQFGDENRPALAAIDSIVLCLSILHLAPAEWRAAWDALKPLILRVREVAELKSLLRVVERDEQRVEGERYEAINLLLLPFDDESRFGAEVRARAIGAERWAKGRPRSESEKRAHERFVAAHEFMKRGDFSAAADCVRIVLDDPQDPIRACRALLILAQAKYRLHDFEGALQAVGDLESRVGAWQSGDVLVEIDALGPYGSKILEAEEHQVAAMAWPGRELRARILREHGHPGEALRDLALNRTEALERGAWWPAFRGLERECEIHLAQGNRAAALDACRSVELAGGEIPRLLGRMQRAVILVEEVEAGSADRGIQDEALHLLEEVSTQLDRLDAGALPEGELDGLRLWLWSHRARYLCERGRFDEAVTVAAETLQLAEEIESMNDTSKAIYLLQRCQERAGSVQNALASAKARYRFATRHLPDLTEDAADGAAAVGRLLLTMVPSSFADKHVVQLAEHWLSRAVTLYGQVGGGTEAKLQAAKEELAKIQA